MNKKLRQSTTLKKTKVCSTAPIHYRQLIRQFINISPFLVLMGVVLPEPTLALTLVVRADVSLGTKSESDEMCTDNDLYVKSSSKGDKRTFVKFDLTALPQSAIVTQATLRTYPSRVNKAGTLTINEVTGTWDEYTLTKFNAPTFIPQTPALRIELQDQKRFVNYDITDLVQKWQTTPAANNGIAITPTPTGSADVIFGSKENISTARPMEIEVAYEGPRGPQGVPGPQGPKGDPGSSTPPPPTQCAAQTFVVSTTSATARTLSTPTTIGTPSQYWTGETLSFGSGNCTGTVTAPFGAIDYDPIKSVSWGVPVQSAWKACTLVANNPTCGSPDARSRIDNGNLPVCSNAAGENHSTATATIVCSQQVITKP
jgi:hypothetical protein